MAKDDGPQLVVFRVYVELKTGLFYLLEVDRYNQPHAKLLLIVKNKLERF